jgi:CYTH domain-containing protein
MATEIELEKTYLLRALPAALASLRPVVIHDVYVPEEANHASLRLRHRGDKYEITKKVPVSGNDSSKQFEHTIVLNQDEFEALAAVSKKDILKRRYSLEIAGRTAEIDVFDGALSGLAVIDFEFDSEEEMNTFEMPPEALADVTQDETIAAGFLAGKTIDEILPRLEKYKYVKVTG